MAARRRPTTKRSATRRSRRSEEELQAEQARERRNARRRELRRLAREAERKAEEARERRNAERRRKRAEAKKAAQEAARKAEEARERRNARRRERYRQQREARRAAERPTIEERRGERFPPQAPVGFERVDIAGRTYSDARRAAADRKFQRWRRQFGDKMAQAAYRIEMALAFVASNMRTEGWEAREEVQLYNDGTIDGELSVQLTRQQATEVGLVGLGGAISRLQEHMDQVQHNQLADCHVQLGFFVPPEYQASGQVTQDARATRAYRRYQDRLRFGFAYQKMGRREGATVGTYEAMRQTALRILDKHRRPPTGLYVRIAWSKDGQLRRRR